MFPIYISPNGHLASCSKYIMQLLVCLINHNKTWHGSEAFHFQQLRDHCGLYPRTPLSTTLAGCDSTVVREYIPWGLVELMHGHQPQSPASICSFPVFSVLAVLASSERSPSRSSSNRPLILILKTALTFFFSPSTVLSQFTFLLRWTGAKTKLYCQDQVTLGKFKSNCFFSLCSLLRWLPIPCVMKSKLPEHMSLPSALITAASAPTLHCSNNGLHTLSHVCHTCFATHTLPGSFSQPGMPGLSSSSICRRPSITAPLRSLPSLVPSTQHTFFIPCLFGYSGWFG